MVEAHLNRASNARKTSGTGGAADASTVSTYALGYDGALTVLDAAVPTTGSAACWVTMSRNGRIAFTTNAASGTLSALRVKRDGQLELLDEDGIAAETGAGSAPIDMALSDDGRFFLFVLSASNGTILTYRVFGAGNLWPLPSIGHLPTSINGLASF